MLTATQTASLASGSVRKALPSPSTHGHMGNVGLIHSRGYKYMRYKSGLYIAAALVVIFETSGVALGAPATACKLLTQQAAAAISGFVVAPGIGADTGGGDICEFNGLAGGGQVSVGLIDKILWGRDPRRGLQDRSSAEPRQTSEPVSGLGETSLYLTSPTDSSVAVLYHAKILMVSAQGSKNPGLKAALVQAARKILGKI